MGEGQPVPNKDAPRPTFLPTDNGWFREASCSRRVDQKRHIARNRTSSHLIIFSSGLSALDLSFHIRREEDHLHRALSVPEPFGSKGLQLVRWEATADLLVDNQESRSRNADRVGQRLPGQIVVNHGRDGANAPEAKKDEDELRGIHKVDGDNLPGLDLVLLLQPGSIAQGLQIDLVEGPGAPIVDDEGTVGGGGGESVMLQHVKEVQMAGAFGSAGFPGNLQNALDET